MFSKAETQELKKEFWTVFGKAFPRKWRLYNTGIKDLSLKFHAGPRSAAVSLDIEMRDEALRKEYFNKITGLANFLKEGLGEYDSDENLTIESGKTIARFWVEKHGVSIYNKDSWRDIFEFYVEKMSAFENIFNDFEDYIKDV